jgi:phosphoglycerol transferase MdoB-like AlkP superfamily enzyme
MFDISGVLYLNLVYLLMLSIPFTIRYNQGYLKIAKIIFLITNSIGIVANCMDMVYFKYTNRRTTSNFFDEFSNENNLLKIIGNGLIDYWYVTLLGIFLLFLLFKFYHNPSPKKIAGEKNYIYYSRNAIAFLLTIMFTIFGIRGGVGSYVRPITLSNANKYVKRSLEASIVLNTPFCIIRTIENTVFKNPNYYTPEELTTIYEPIITPHPKKAFNNMNVVVLIVESLSKEFIGELNKNIDNGQYKGYTPFLDSLIRESLTFEYTYSNGRKSIDAMPSVLSSIPMFYEPYFLTRYSTNEVSGIAGELNKKGYYTSFFHGAPNGSMGFEAFAKTSGFTDYFGLDEYGNDKDYDGTWSIWDEEFLQFFGEKINGFKQPFMTAVFTATSHNPFVVPEKYNQKFPEEGGHPIYKCIRYTDYSLKKFFENASKQPWYKNTLFVITADHTNALTKKEYLNDPGGFKVPIIFYHYGSDLKGHINDIAQQIDIMPTILGYLNYDKPYLAFGNDLLDPNYKEHYAINYFNQIFQYFKGDYFLQFDGQKTTAVYNLKTDPFLQNNLIGKFSEQAAYEKQIKAIAQQYVVRMLNNKLVVTPKD